MDEFYDFALYTRTYMSGCTLDPNVNLCAPDFSSYMTSIGIIQDLQARPQQMRELASIDIRYYDLEQSTADFFKTEFPLYVRKFRADNKVWEQHELAYSTPDVYMPASAVTVRYTRMPEPGLPIVFKGKLYTMGLDHFLKMWSERVLLTPQALDVLIAAQSINCDSESKQLIPLKISPDGASLFIGDLQTSAFETPVDCTWLLSFVGSRDDFFVYE